jgi:outer membrane lipoprotein-sorting protein
MRTPVICIVLYVLAAGCLTAQSDSCCAASTDPNTTPPAAASVLSPLQKVLDRLQDNASKLTSCTSKIEYLFIQDPDLLDSHSLRKGNLFYLKSEDRSRVRLNFETLKQDDFEEEARREVYLFDGVWLTKVDYALEQIDLYQQSPEDKPLDAFDFLSHHFPLVGFSGSKQFETEFDVTLAETSAEEPNLICLHLEVREDSRYSKDYKTIDFRIDNQLYLPRRVYALSTQGDIYDIRFLDIQTNKKLEKETFTIETPGHFRKNVEALKQEPETKGQD